MCAMSKCKFIEVPIIDLLGLPPVDALFYPSMLGAILFGIGIALLLELIGYNKRLRGLGLGGAIVINGARYRIRTTLYRLYTSLNFRTATNENTPVKPSSARIWR